MSKFENIQQSSPEVELSTNKSFDLKKSMMALSLVLLTSGCAKEIGGNKEIINPETGVYNNKEVALKEYNKLKAESKLLWLKKENAYQNNSPEFDKLQAEYVELEKKMKEINYNR